MTPQRVVTYIDGFNLYFGLRQSGWRRHYWLDLVALSKALLKPDQRWEQAHYFTSRTRSKGTAVASGEKRQSDYLDALGTRAGLTIHYGHFLAKTRSCFTCQTQWQDFEEKMTDVNIAVRLLLDAYDGAFDTAVLVSGDSDLTTPVREVRQRFPQKRIVIAFPPARHSVELQKAASGYFTISEAKLRQSQLPESVRLANGHVVNRPQKWQ